MRDRFRNWTLEVTITAVLISGCVGTDKDLSYITKADATYHKHVSQTIDYPDVYSASSHEAADTLPPRTIASRKKDKVRDMTLVEAIHIALANNRIIRSASALGQANGANVNIGGSGNTTSPRGGLTPSIFDPAIQETGVLFGGRGVEAALAEFDPTFFLNTRWGRSETVQNSLFFSGGLAPGSTLQRDTGVFRSGISKRFADGGSFLVGHDWDYNGSLIPGQLFPSSYSGNIRAEYRRPLWAASGVEYTRIAGPSNPNFGAITGVSQGVVISRINNDISLADFEAAVRNLIADVHNAYWKLYLRYRQFDAAVVARNSAKLTWQEADTKKGVGGLPGFALQDEAQARDQYYKLLAAANDANNEIFVAESRLRLLMGLKVNDGTIIRPKDEPAKGEVKPDWTACLTEALSQRVELRRQKWNIKSLELQLKAAKSLTNPRLDFTTSYQVNGFGDHLLRYNDRDSAGSAQGLNSAYETLTQGDQTSWFMGFEFSMPIGFRSANAQVQNIKLRLLKARKILAAQELEISHELANAFQNLALNYANMKANYERLPAAQERTRILQVQYKLGLNQGKGGVGVTADIVLRSQSDKAQAEIAYYASRVAYDKSITEIEFRKGTMLPYHNVFLAEGAWTPQAYRQALRRARSRSHALQNERMLHSEPEPFAFPQGVPSTISPQESTPEPLMENDPQGRPGVPPQPADPKKNDANPFPKRDDDRGPVLSTSRQPDVEPSVAGGTTSLSNLDGFGSDAIAPRNDR